jgi:hypothetical protein
MTISTFVPTDHRQTSSQHIERITRSQLAFHEVLRTESQASLRIVDLTASESAGQADSRDRYQPHRSEHLLHRTLIAGTNSRKWKHLKTTCEQMSYVSYML